MDIFLRMVLIKDTSIKDGMKNYLPYLQYASTYGDNPCSLMNIHSSSKCVSYYTEYGKGMILFVPDIILDDEMGEKGSKLEKEYYEYLCELPKILRKKN